MTTHPGLIVDLFAGAGGASLGLEAAFGRAVDIALNHNPEAVAIHLANHPSTRHFVQHILMVRPIDATLGQPVDVLWASPDCSHFSKAKGKAPKARHIRELGWSVVRWIQDTKPKLAFIENVEEYLSWGPLDDQGQPIKELAGITFQKWVKAIEREGYSIDWRFLRACDYGAPTLRRRLFIVCRRDRKPIVWPEPTHGHGRDKPWRAAAECINWNLPCPSLFNRKKPLVEKTLRRIAEGLRRYVLEAQEPFIVSGSEDESVASCLAPFVQHVQHGSRGPAGVMPLNEPLRTITAWPKGGSFALVAAYLTKYFGTSVAEPLSKPLSTICSNDKLALTCAYLVKYFGTGVCRDLRAPAATVTTRDRFGLVSVPLVKIGGEDYVIADIGFRMLKPRELARCQGFQDGYYIDPLYNGKRLSQKAQVASIGHSVSPIMAEVLARANMDAVAYRNQRQRVPRIFGAVDISSRRDIRCNP